jgi:Acyl-protein synthetase, LuxE
VAAFEEIATRVLAFIDASAKRPVGPGDDAAFDALARAVFAFQYDHDPSYRRLCDRRRRSPDRVDHWSDVPAVPTAAFKTLDLVCAPPERIFLTSGTTRGTEARGRHLVPRLELYRRSALAHFDRMVLPDRIQPRIVGLLGSPETLPHSSLSQMVEWIRTDLAGGDGEYLVDARGLEAARALERIDALAADGRPLCLIGWRVAFTSVIAHCQEIGRSLALPADSRIVDTGGPKGGRALSDAGFLAACWHVFSVPGYYCVNEYGMTELCSQLYDDVLLQRFAGSNEPRRKLGPAWTRTRAVDPASLAPLPDGEPGILCHVDLANAGSVLAVQTEDVGVVQGGRVRLMGRLPDAEPRGCALALADLLGESR